MSNKSSPHGGFISEGTISHGTLRTQDLLRTFADEYARVLPFNSFERCFEARELADALDLDPMSAPDGVTVSDMAHQALPELLDALDTVAGREGFYFGTHPGDGSDFGYWAIELDD